MTVVSEIGQRVKSVVLRSREEREMDEEMRFHIDKDTEQHVRAGMSAREARRQAHIKFGDIERIKERTRDARGVRWLDDLARLFVRPSSGSLVRALRPAGGAIEGESSPPYGWAVLSGGVVFLLYVVTLAPTTAFWDTSEYIATSHILGIPHQPGNPLFVVLAKAWSLLLAPTGLSVAVRVNLFSAFMSASAHGFWFLVVHHVLSSFSEERLFRLAGTGTAILVSATAFTVWNQSNVNEKVYTVSLFTIALLTWLAIRWKDRVGRGGELNLLILMAFILALSVGNHLMAFLAAPALGLFILVGDPRTVLNWRLYPPVLIAALFGLSIHLFLPIRAELNPVINEASPECASVAAAMASVATYGGLGCEPLNAAIRRRQYTVEGEPGPGFSGPRQAPLGAQLTNYLQYFDWQWGRSIDGDNSVFASLRLPFTLLFAFFGIWGLTEHMRRDKATFWYFAALFGTLSLGLVVYLNFKYGYTLQAPVADRDLHEVRERDYFFVASFSVWGLWAGMGLATMWRDITRALGTSLVRAAPILGLALIPLVTNWSWASRADDWVARDWAHNLLMSVEPYGVLFTNGDNDTFPLWYLQEVEGIRQDVTVIVTSYFKTAWYAQQLRDITRPCSQGVSAEQAPTRITCQRDYTADNTDSVYIDDVTDAGGKVPLLIDRPIVSPTKSIIPLDDSAIEGVLGTFIRLERDQSLHLGRVVAHFRAGQLVSPWMQLALTVINESRGERPIYFSSIAGAASDLGLTDQLVRQGVAFKLDPSVSGGDTDALRLARSPYSAVTGQWIDVQRTRALMDHVFAYDGGIPDEWSHWPDRPSIGIPNYYAWAYLSLAIAASQAGEHQEAVRYRERSEAWTALGT